ncbi:homoserine O-acetyltransferase MetX [Nafulsella turpanensis]|uniref:homoserine O-acetyltransferase MetX n=1 Tax=Nafulsella turpanensis TaxID=1265690 RepID=UPI000686B0B7|nr:homoserine O-acetyltransferase [Nafulsella turpanensis]
MHLQHFKYPHPLPLQNGGELQNFELAYFTWGTLNAEGTNAIWVCHALTGSANVEEWWSELIGPGKLLDTDRYFIICANTPGSCYGSTGPLSISPVTYAPYYHSFPLLTNHDVVTAFDLLRKELGIGRLSLLIGGSLGGQQALQWAVKKPEVAERLVLLATNARHSPWGIAFNETQRMAIASDMTWKLNSPKAGLQGLKTARGIAMLSYRTYQVYEKKQQDQEPRPDNGFRAAEYQQYQGEKLAARFNAFSYWILSKMMDAHDVGRGYGSVVEALARVKAQTLVIGIDSDLLFPPSEQEYLSEHIPDASFRLISSVYGHDGFLVETEAVQQAVREVLKFPQAKTFYQPTLK